MDEVKAIGPLVPWLCERRMSAGMFTLTLYATDPNQIEADWDFIKVLGRLLATKDVK